MIIDRASCLGLDYGQSAKNIGIVYPVSAKQPVHAKLSKTRLASSVKKTVIQWVTLN